MTQNPLCYGIYGNGWKIAKYLIGDHYPGSAQDVRTNVYANALLEAMLNQNCFICAKFLHIKFANVTPFERPEEMHSTSVVWCCYIVIFFHIFLLGLAKQLFIPVPLPSPNRGNPPILQMAFRSLHFFPKIKKNISVVTTSQCGITCGTIEEASRSSKAIDDA